MQYTVGVLVFALPLASQWLRGVVLPWHVALGLLVYVSSALTAASGVVEKLAFMGHCQAQPGTHYHDILQVGGGQRQQARQAGRQGAGRARRLAEG